MSEIEDAFLDALINRTQLGKSKAFDNITHTHILDYILELVLGEKFHKFISSFLRSKKATLKIGDLKSDPLELGPKGCSAVVYAGGKEDFRGDIISRTPPVPAFRALLFLAAFIRSTRLSMPWGEGDILLGLLPITHISGMAYTMMAILEGACCAHVSAKLTPTEILDTVDKYKPTAALFFPSLLQAIVRVMRRTGRDLPSMRAITVGGSVLTAATAEAVHGCFSGLKVLQKVYGMTESCALATCQSKTGEPHNTADVGVPLSNFQIKVVDVHTRQKLGPHQTGEICYRSPTVVRGYHKRPKQSAELFDEEGWCISGDAGYYDENGRLYIVERLKQLIKCMDNQVVPAELEELLLRQHAEEIAEVSVVGLPHSDYGEAPAAAIVPSEVGSRHDLLTLAERIKATVASNLAVHKHLYGGVYFVDSFPKTETAKVNRPALARSLLRS
ncbi:uncharacterized protein [Dermacentor andersoni]|uniref:uncharacterized protein n=1 Tax=Dermacentor andersoni TaxID=34620 RepID=UPI003B3B4655